MGTRVPARLARCDAPRPEGSVPSAVPERAAHRCPGRARRSVIVGAACSPASGPASPGRGISRSTSSGTPCETRRPVIARDLSARTVARRAGGSQPEPSRRRAASCGARKDRGLADPNGSTGMAPDAGAGLLRGAVSGWRDDRPTCPAPTSGHGPALFPSTRRARAPGGSLLEHGPPALACEPRVPACGRRPRTESRSWPHLPAGRRVQCASSSRFFGRACGCPPRPG